MAHGFYLSNIGLGFRNFDYVKDSPNVLNHVVSMMKRRETRILLEYRYPDTSFELNFEIMNYKDEKYKLAYNFVDDIRSTLGFQWVTPETVARVVKEIRDRFEKSAMPPGVPRPRVGITNAREYETTQRKAAARVIMRALRKRLAEAVRNRVLHELFKPGGEGAVRAIQRVKRAARGDGTTQASGGRRGPLTRGRKRARDNRANAISKKARA